MTYLRHTAQRATTRIADRPDQLVLAIVVFGLVLRLAWVVFAHGPANVGDPNAYVFHGDDLSRGLGYRSHDTAMLQNVGLVPRGELPPTAFYAIGYPLVLAALFRIVRFFGVDGSYESYAWVYGIAHAIIGAATVWLVARVARRVVSERATVIAALLVAVWPNLVMYSATANLETVYLFVLMLATLVLLQIVQSADGISISRLLLLGATVGVAAQIRPLVALAFPVLLLTFRRKPLPWRSAIGATVVVGVVTLALLAPWTIRNARAMPGVVLVTTGTGDALCLSRYVGSPGTYEFGSPGCVHDFPDLRSDEAEIVRNRENTKRAIEFVEAHPVEEVKLWFRRGLAAYRDDHEARTFLEARNGTAYLDPIWPNAPTRRLADVVADLWYWCVAAIGIVGLRRFARLRTPGSVAVIGLIAASAIIPIMLFGDPRYKVPILPFLAIVAAHRIATITSRNPTVPARSDTP